MVESTEIIQITGILPDELIEEILVMVPVKHLLRLKCVCKHWYALIGDCRFHKKHYEFQYAKHLAEHNDIPLFLDDTGLFMTHLFHLLSKRQGVDVVLDLTPDFERDISPTFANDVHQLPLSCLGIVNGVVCLEWGLCVYPCDRRRLALWNPATREFKDIPRWPVFPGNEPTRLIDTIMMGLGFDLQANDFKILGHLFSIGTPRKEVFEFRLYSLKADSWKGIKEPPRSFSNLRHSRTDTYLNNGVAYWLEVDSSDNPFSHHHFWILSFTLSTEIFKESKLPESYGCNHGKVPCNCEYPHMIGKYKEGLGLYVTHTLENTDYNIEIWAVSKFSDDGNGVPLYWQRVCTIGPIHSFNYLCRLSVSTIRVSGDLLVSILRGDSVEEAEGYIYDPSTRTFNYLGVEFWSSFSYVESLYCLSGRIN